MTTTLRALIAAVLAATLLAATPGDAAARSCRPILDVAFLEGSRYEGSDIFRITANVSCRTARRVARGATRKALGMPPPPSGIKRFRYRSWSVIDDVRGATDRFSAHLDDATVRWRFGERG